MFTPNLNFANFAVKAYLAANSNYFYGKRKIYKKIGTRGFRC